METEQSSKDTIRLVIAAPFPPPYGGATVLAEQLFQSLARLDDFDITAIDTRSNERRPLRRALGRLVVFLQVLRSIPSSDVVSVHGSSTGLHLVAPIFALGAFLMRKPIIFRRFGGAGLLPSGRLARWAALRAFRSADCVFVETHALMASAHELSIERVAWLPNSRPMVEASPPPNGQGRFVYVGLVDAAKGVDTLVACGDLLRRDVSIDIYGPVAAGFDMGPLEASSAVTYRGVLAPSRVPEVLANYSALVFPTMYVGEGLPGVVVEAYAAGIPVIATRWRSVPEIVTARTGILVAPGSPEELATALDLLAVDAEMLDALRTGVSEVRETYNSSIWDQEFADVVRRLAGRATRGNDRS